MSRGYVVFGDIEGKLDVLHVECTKCGRGERYGDARLIEKHGREGNLMKWASDLGAEPASVRYRTNGRQPRHASKARQLNSLFRSHDPAHRDGAISKEARCCVGATLLLAAECA
jgi:hypothetical protein